MSTKNEGPRTQLARPFCPGLPVRLYIAGAPGDGGFLARVAAPYEPDGDNNGQCRNRHREVEHDFCGLHGARRALVKPPAPKTKSKFRFTGLVTTRQVLVIGLRN